MSNPMCNGDCFQGRNCTCAKPATAQEEKPVPDELHKTLCDALSGWTYIRETHGDLYGVGWDRVEDRLRKQITESAARIKSQVNAAPAPATAQEEKQEAAEYDDSKRPVYIRVRASAPAASGLAEEIAEFAGLDLPPTAEGSGIQACLSRGQWRAIYHALHSQLAGGGEDMSRCLSHLSRAIRNIAKHGFEKDATTDDIAFALWQDLNIAQANAIAALREPR